MWQPSLNLPLAGEFSHAHRDVVLTPDNIAAAIVQHFSPTGRCLDPCKGDGAFLRHMPGADYCELQEGRDFFDWQEPVDWIIGNPPYSIWLRWLQHSFRLAADIVYLIPINKAFNSHAVLKETYEWGGIAQIVHIGPGTSINFPFGFAVGAVHYQRAYQGGIMYRYGF